MDVLLSRILLEQVYVYDRIRALWSRVRAALSDEFSSATGLYYDNDSKQFASPHPDATDLQKIHELVRTIDEILGKKVV